MEEGNFASETMWGHSVDKIHPVSPSNFLYSHDGNNVTYEWDYSIEEDFNYHFINGLWNTDFTVENFYNYSKSDEHEHDEHWVQSVDIHDNMHALNFFDIFNMNSPVFTIFEKIFYHVT